MIKYLQQRFALTEKGAKDLRKGIAFSTLMNLALMLPPTYLFFFLMEYIDSETPTEPHTLCSMCLWLCSWRCLCSS